MSPLLRPAYLAMLLISSAIVTSILPSSAAAETSLVGPRLDEIAWSEALDTSAALSSVMAGEADLMTWPLRSYSYDARDVERAHKSRNVTTFPVYPFLDELTVNPARQSVGPENPFAIQEVREALQYLIDRDFVVRDIFGGRALPMRTLWNPRSAEYGRHIGDLAKLEDRYAFDPAKGRAQMFAALEAAGWAIGSDGLWHDSNGTLVTIKVSSRLQDERILLGRYYEQILSGLHFQVQGISIFEPIYGLPPDENRWHLYTAAWREWTGAWHDDRIGWFAACGIGESWCGAVTGFYAPPSELLEIAERLALGQYQGLSERKALIVRGTELAMQESIRVFIDTRESPYVSSRRMADATMDLATGAESLWTLRTAVVPEDPTTGLRTARVLNFQMFVDGWNPWVQPGWLYDRIPRNAMIDPAMAIHPHTQRWIDYRTVTTVESAGPAGTFTIPDDAVVFNVTTNAWQSVGPSATAVSKVTLDMVYGKWHHGADITMDDIVYTWSNLWRRTGGDLVPPGLVRCPAPECRSPDEAFVADVLKAIRPLDSDTLEVYVDYWHIDPSEIAAAAARFPSAPWEVQELAGRLIADEIASPDDVGVGSGLIWLDLTKGDSLPHLAAQLSNFTAENHVPPGMASWISASEATARWSALNAWATTHGHYWTSNGPFSLVSVNSTDRRVVMKAFREGYPFSADAWQSLATLRPPEISFLGIPELVVSGAPAVFDYLVTGVGTPPAEVVSQWYVRDLSAALIRAEGTSQSSTVGRYRIELPATLTSLLVDRPIELVVTAVSSSVAIPAVARIPVLAVTSSGDLRDMVDGPASRFQRTLAELQRLREETAQLARDVDALASQVSTLQSLALVGAVGAAASLSTSVAGLLIVLRHRRRRGDAS